MDDEDGALTNPSRGRKKYVILQTTILHSLYKPIISTFADTLLCYVSMLIVILDSD